MFKFESKGLDFSHKLGNASSPKDEYGRHMHYFYEIVFFLKGECSYTVEGDMKKLASDDLVLIRPGKFHFATVDWHYPYDRYVLKFPSEILPPFLQKKLLDSATFYSHATNLEYLFRQLEYLDTSKKYTEEELYVIFCGKIVELLINLTKIEENQQIDKDSLISSITTYIEEHIREHLSLEKISQDLGYSGAYLSNAFRQKMNVSLMHYIRSKKAILARDYIINGMKPHEVADMFGFTDYSTFYRTYVKVIGTAPVGSKKA